MKIPQNTIEEIASSIDIVDVISAYTPLRKAGRSFMGRCPFHEEKTPSFSVSQEKGVYHCFGCGKSGNVFTFVMDMDNVSFFEAAKLLAEKAGIRIEFEDEPFDEDRNLVEKIVEINNKAAHYFHDNLMGRDGEYAREYLRERSVKDEMLTKFGLGYSLREKDALYKELSKAYSNEELTASGLFLNLPQNEMRDRFRGRLMFPIISEFSRVAGFGGRKLYESEGFDEAKYVNSSETKIYNKSKILYGLNFAKTRIKETGFAILVEGYMDLISLFQNGFENVVASSGTSLTPLQVKILSRYTLEVVVVYDSDIAGQNASMRAIELIIENNLNVNIVVLPGGEDPDTYIRKQGKDAFQRLVDKRQSVINYIGEGYRQDGKLESPEGKTEFVRRIINLIAKMRDEIKRDFYIKDIAARFSIYESSIRKELDKQLKLGKKGITRDVRREVFDEPPEHITGAPKPSSSEIMLIRLLVDSDAKTKEYLMNNLETGFIANDTIRRIVNYIMININNSSKLTHVNLFNEFHDDETKKIIGNALLDENYVLQEEKNKNYTSDARIIISQFKLLDIRKQIKEIENKLKASNKYEPEALELLTAQQKLKNEQLVLEKSLKSI
jgi:DNA primase